MTEEEQAIAELKKMTKAELELVPFTILKWNCAGKNCSRFTRIRDYGIAPEYYHKNLAGPDNKKVTFFDITNQYFFCAKHNKLYKRLNGKYDKWHVWQKLFDITKPKFID